MLSDLELRQAAFALNIIAECGSPDEFAYAVRQAMEKAPAAYDRDNMTVGQSNATSQIAAKLVEMLGEPRDRCEAAAVYAIGTSRQRLKFEAIIRYAIELIGPCTELTGESPFLPSAGAESKLKTKPATRPKVRIVADERKGPKA